MELGLPELMTQNDRTAIVSFVVQNKGSAEHRSHAQHTKEICGHILHFDHRRRFVSSRSEFPRCSVGVGRNRSEEHTSELHHSQISYAVFCLKKKKKVYEI